MRFFEIFFPQLSDVLYPNVFMKFSQIKQNFVLLSVTFIKKCGCSIKPSIMKTNNYEYRISDKIREFITLTNCNHASPWNCYLGLKRS